MYEEACSSSVFTNTPFTRWSKHEANLAHTSCTCVLNTFASCLLHHVNLVLDCYLVFTTCQISLFVDYAETGEKQINTDMEMDTRPMCETLISTDCAVIARDGHWLLCAGFVLSECKRDCLYKLPARMPCTVHSQIIAQRKILRAYCAYW